MEINYALIGKRIRETRKQRGLSAEELAEIADLSTVYISTNMPTICNIIWIYQIPIR